MQRPSELFARERMVAGELELEQRVSARLDGVAELVQNDVGEGSLLGVAVAGELDRQGQSKQECIGRRLGLGELQQSKPTTCLRLRIAPSDLACGFEHEAAFVTGAFA